MDASGFEEFWKAYPRKTGKGAALKLWRKLKPGKALQEAILKAVAAQSGSAQWGKDGGQFIPHPATWLSQGRWEDDADPIVKTGILARI